MRALNDILERALLAFTGMLFAGFILAVLIQVLGRNVFTTLPVLWAMDAALLLFAWTVFLGAAIALRQRKHYLIEFVPAHMSRANATMQVVASILVAGALIILIDGGFAFLPNAFTRRSLALGISEGYFFMAIPVAAVFMALFHVEVLLEDVKRLKNAFQDAYPFAGSEG